MPDPRDNSPRRTFIDRLRRILCDLDVQRRLLILTLLPAAWIPGTAAGGLLDRPTTRPTTARQPAYVIHVPGVAGPMRIDRRLADGIAEGGDDGFVEEVEIFNWVGDRRGLPAVFGIEENKRQARLLAEHLLQLKREQPDRPVLITAHSGGTAIVAWALELLPELAAGEGEWDDVEDGQGGEEPANVPPLPEGLKVDGVVLLASGLSGGFDLSPALANVKGQVFHLSSDADNFILGAGTMIFGTLDRVRGLAAGKTGFLLPTGLDALAYANFAEIAYDLAWRDLGHFGDHEGMMTRAFAKTVVIPLLRASTGEPVDNLPATRAIPHQPRHGVPQENHSLN